MVDGSTFAVALHYAPGASMRFRATAKSSERSNAAGAVELECVEQGLLDRKSVV